MFSMMDIKKIIRILIRCGLKKWRGTLRNFLYPIFHIIILALFLYHSWIVLKEYLQYPVSSLTTFDSAKVPMQSFSVCFPLPDIVRVSSEFYKHRLTYLNFASFNFSLKEINSMTLGFTDLFKDITMRHDSDSVLRHNNPRSLRHFEMSFVETYIVPFVYKCFSISDKTKRQYDALKIKSSAVNRYIFMETSRREVTLFLSKNLISAFDGILDFKNSEGGRNPIRSTLITTKALPHPYTTDCLNIQQLT